MNTTYQLIQAAKSGQCYGAARLALPTILMGSTIDYGILFSTYYRDCRETMDMCEALKAAYQGSIETIMTSESI